MATPVILTLAEFEDRMPTGVPRIAVDRLMARPLRGRLLTQPGSLGIRPVGASARS